MKSLGIKKTIGLTLAATIAFSFSGCLKSEAPKCSDAGVKELLKDLYQMEMDSPLYNKKDGFPAILSIDSVRTLSYDKEVAKRECKATVNFDRDLSGDIEYSVQLSEEIEGDYYVETKTSFVGILMMSAMQNKFKF